MVGVEGDGFVAGFHNPSHKGLAFLILQLNHAVHGGHIIADLTLGNVKLQARIVLAVSFLRGNLSVGRGPHGKTVKRLLKARNNISVAV